MMRNDLKYAKGRHPLRQNFREKTAGYQPAFFRDTFGTFSAESRASSLVISDPLSARRSLQRYE